MKVGVIVLIFMSNITLFIYAVYTVPPVHNRQACLDQVCTPQWSEVRALTSQAVKQQTQEK